MKRLCLTLALAFAACAVRAEAYFWDFSGAAAEAAEAPVVRRASMACAAEVPRFAVGDTLDLRLFDDVGFAFRIVSAPPAGIAGQSFIAKDENGSASAIVKVTDSAARISVDDFANLRQYTVRCKDGQVLIVERDNSQADGGECGTCGGEIEVPQQVVEETKITSTTKSRTLLGASGDAFPVAAQKSVVDVLVAFDKGAKAWAEKSSNWGGGGDSIEEFADYAVNKMNSVLQYSQLNDQFCYRLVGVIEIDGTWTAINNALLLSMRAREGAFAKLSQLRDKYGADTITLLVNRTSGTTSGIGFEYSGNAGKTIEYFNSMNYACNVCDINTVYSRYTMSHETGHNMGCGHSNRQGDNSGPGRYSYSCGYHFTDVGKVRRHTIMAYSYSADDSYEYSPVPYFSTPDISPAEYGCALGVEGVNDNRQTLQNTHADIAGLRDRKLPYDWDVRFLDDNGKDIADGTFFYSSTYVTLTNANPAAEIYYTLDGTTPTSASEHVSPGESVYVYLVYGSKTLTACAVVDGKAQSVRSITLHDGHPWSGYENGAGLWLNGDSSVRPWNGEYFYNGDAVMFPDLAGVSSATVTVKGAVAPSSVSFSAINTAYTFDKGDDAAQITIPDANFAPVGDVTFNVPVLLSATTFTNMTGCALTFNAPFGQTIDATSGYCTNLVTISPYGTMTVAPGAGKTQSFDTLNNQNGGFSGNATFRVGEGRVEFNGKINGGAGVIGRTQLAVGNGGELVFNMGGGTGHQMNQTSLTVEKGGVVRFNNMEHLRRTLYLDDGTIYAKRFDLMSNPGVYVADDSAIENNGEGYILIRDSDSEIKVSEGKTLTLNIGTQTDDRNDTSGWGIIKRGGGTLVANVELTHSGVTDIKSGSLEVGYSSGSTIFGLGWIVAEGSTLKVKSGCTLKTPTLTLDSGATISVSAAASAPIVATNNVSVSGVYFELADVDNLAAGVSYPLLKGNAGISDAKNAKTSGLPALAKGLKWQLEVSDSTLYAKVVEKSAIEEAVPFTSNDPSLALAMPDDATVAEGGGAKIAASPIGIGGLSTKAVSIAVKVVVPETSPSDVATICSWRLGDYKIYCVRETTGKLNCRWIGTNGSLGTTANQTNDVALAAGEHLLQIGYYSNGSGGTRVLLDGKVAYIASGLVFSGESVNRVTFGATAEDSPRYPYAGLVVREAAVLDVVSSEPAPRMTASGGSIYYSLNVPGVIPRVFPLTPSGALALDETVVEATFAETPSEATVSVMASFPADSAGTVCGMWVKRDTSAALPVAIQAEYDGDGKFYIRFNDNSLNSEVATRLAETALDVSKPHLYTLMFKAGEGATFYQDGVALLKSESAFSNYSASNVVSPITFGCGPYHLWRGSSWHDYPNPAKDFSLYASHIALGTSDRTVSEAAVRDSIATEDDDPSPPETPATVDVLVAYDNGAQAYVANKGVTLTEFAATQIEKMNAVLATNRLDRYYSYRLAGVCKVDGTYTNIDTAPGLIAAGEGPAVSLRAARELYGADTVSLLVDTTSNTIGNSSPLNSPNDVASQHECAFSVCSVRAVDTGKQHTMIHENAHNMGCGHARAQSIINSPFEYGRGYYFTDGNVTRHTIMAYGGDNDASWYFSTTSTEFGFVLGDETNNNARVLKETCAEVAKWREGAAIGVEGVGVDGVAWQTSALYPWSIEDGALRSFNQTNYTYQCTTPLKATIEGPRRLSFSHKSYFGGESVAGNNYSHFDVLLDDSPVLTQTECRNEWREAYVDVPEGEHEVAFVFSQRFAMNNPRDYKDGTPDADDGVWLKELSVGEIPTVEPFFDWTPNNAPTGGWVASWGGEANNVTQSVVGPDGWPTNVYRVTDSNASQKWSPYQVSCTAKDAFTFVTYGCADAVSATSTGPAILWCMGRKGYGNITMLVKDGDGHIRLVSAPSAATSYTSRVDLGKVAGWHLFTVRFSTTGGASVQIDDRDPVADPTFVTMPGNGIQIGSLLGGIGSGNPFSRGTGFAVLRMVGYGTADLPAEQYAALCAEYPAATCAHSSTSDEVSWTFPQDATKVPESYVDGLVLGETGIVNTLEFDGTNAVVASVLAELPDGVRGEIAGCQIYRASNGEKFYAFAYSNGDGTFSLGHGTTTNKVTSSAVADWTAPHVWTFAFAAQTGARLYCDGVEIASSDGIMWNNTSVTGAVTFGDDPRGGWSLSGAKFYAVHTDFGVGSAIFTAAEDAANSPLADLDFLADHSDEPIANQLAVFDLYMTIGVTTTEVTHACVLRISEILPKPTDARTLNGLEGMDVNGLESGWVEVENTSDLWADLADYRFIRVNRGKKTDPAGVGNFPSRLVPPHGRAIFYTSERYSNSKDKAVSAFAEGTFDGKPMIFEDYGNILVWGDKVNPKKSPYVRLYYAPGGDSDTGTVVDTVVVPSDLPEGWSIIVGDAAEGEGTRRWMCPTPTRGTANSATTGLTRIGPNVGPLYEKPDQKKTDLASEFAVITPPAIPGTDYTVTLPINAVMNPDGTFAPRDADVIQSIKFVYRKDLDDTTLVTNNIDMAAKTTDANWGDQYAATIPASYFPAAGHLMQWKVLITDGEGVEWTSPSFNNKDDGYEWYGTIVEPGELNSATLPTWHMFASGNHLTQMDVDADKQDRSLVPNQARIAIYDSSTSNYYDYVRIDLRGNTSAGFTKKGHGLRFAKAHPLTMRDIVSGEDIEEIRKTSLISEFADPSFMRQMIAFWLWRKMGNLVPFDFPVRCNLNGEFYQLAFNSERFTDELIEDVYGLDKFGYGYKNVGTLKSGSGTTAGGIEKKTPDDEDESNITVLQSELRSKITAAQSVSGTTEAAKSSTTTDTTGLDNAALTKFVVQKFDLPAWLNYLASAKITQEMDDVWANICAYYDNPDMLQGARGKGTWMPLGYDFNISFGQYYQGDIGAKIGLMSTNDWFKSHPFYGGNRVRCWKGTGMGTSVNYGNDAFEAVWQSAKFRRLYLRRLRTLMDQEFKEPGTPESEVPFMAKMREMADLMRADSALDLAKWPDDGSDNAIDVWPTGTRPADMDAGIDEIWDNYVVPRREHLYVTHSVTNTARVVGYGSNLNAGIPEAQSPIATLAPNISISNLTALDAEQAEALGVTGQFYGAEVVVIRNDNDEVVDMSGWKLAYSVDFTFPAGTVCDANDAIYIVADRRAYIDAHEAELTDQVIVGNATFTGTGPIAIFAADGTQVFAAIPETNEKKYLRLHSFCGNTNDGESGDTGEWFALTNISDSVTLDLADVTVCFLKQGDDHDTTTHCHVTLTNKKGKGDVKPLMSWTANQADWSDKGWTKIQNNKQQITIYDKYGSVCQSLKVTQKDFPLAYGAGGWLVCDSQDASVTSGSQWHQEFDLANGTETGSFDAKNQSAADAAAAAVTITLTTEDLAAGLEAQYLKVVAEPVEGSSGKYKAVVAVNPETVNAPEIAEPTAESEPIEIEEDEDGETVVSAKISNAVIGLWYGYEVADELDAAAVFGNDVGSFDRATNATHKVKGSPRTQPSGFFRVKVLPAKPDK